LEIVSNSFGNRPKMFEFKVEILIDENLPIFAYTCKGLEDNLRSVFHHFKNLGKKI
jgi:hypothetical protein